MKKSDADWCLAEQQNIRNGAVTYFGLVVKKLPLDLWIYQEIIVERKPEVIVEVGNRTGGSTLFLAHVLEGLTRPRSRCRPLGVGQVVAVDNNRDMYNASHPRILEVTGGIETPEVLDKVRRLVAGHSCMVIHDSQHGTREVLRDLTNLCDLVTPGQYFVVEDGIIDVWKTYSGPLAAIREFLPKHPEFRVDESRERYGITWNPGGYLERIA